MDDSAAIRATVLGVGVMLALVIFTALNYYYSVARDEARKVAGTSNIDYTYEKSIEETFNKDELLGYEVKNLINHYNKSPLVRVDIHNANYLDTTRQVLYRAFINANATTADYSASSYEDAVNLLFPFQSFKLTKFETNKYMTFILDGKYDKAKENEYNIENIAVPQIKQMMQYYLENTYVIVELRNVQNIRTRLVPITDENGVITGYTNVKEREIKNFLNANNSFATSRPKQYDEALTYLNNNQEYTVTISKNANAIVYVITGKQISLG